MLEKPINRRQLLKLLLAASGGIAAASFLPAKWLKPVVNAGVLPVHARASAAYILEAERGKAVEDKGVFAIWDIKVGVFLPGSGGSTRGGYKLASPARITGIPQPGVEVTMNYQQPNSVVSAPSPALSRKATTISTPGDPDYGYAIFGRQDFTTSVLDPEVVLTFQAGGSSTTLDVIAGV